jgi:predicted dehydrogenase
MTERPIVAMIGAGRWGRNILRTLADSTTVAYVAHGGSGETTAFLRSSYPDAQETKDYHEALSDDAVEAVAIATPIETHADIVRDALTAKKHVFCEKPLARTRAHVHELYTLATEHDRVLMTGYLYLFDPEYRALLDAFNGVHDIEAEFTWEKFGSFDAALDENLLVHDLALAHALLGGISLESIEKNEADVMTLVVTGERGRARIHIDRTKEHRIKRVSAHAGDIVRTHEWTADNLLDLELASFLASLPHGAKDNEKRQRIDESIAAVIEELRR